MNYYSQPHRLKTDLMAQGPDFTFHRVLWATLVAVALTFGVILTSVFVDIDGLLKQSSPDGTQESINAVYPSILEEYQDFPKNNNIDDYLESDSRSKRSSDSDNVFYHINNPKMKKILTTRLAVLLDELDRESLQVPKFVEDFKADTKPSYASTDDEFDKDISLVKDKTKEYLKEDLVKNNVLRQGMHNIILQGLIGHMDLNGVYKKAQLLAKAFDGSVLNAKELGKELKENSNELENDILNENSKQLMKIIRDSYSEDMFLKELLNCKKLRDQISHSKNTINSHNNEIAKDPSLLIKMIIEISKNGLKKRVKPSTRENAKGLIKLLYNKKPVELSELSDDKKVQNITAVDTKIEQSYINANINSSPEDFDNTIKNNSILDQAIAEYFKTHVNLQNVQNTVNKAKRLKRQIKIRYKDDGATTEKPNEHKGKSKKDDEELYIEIETHFDGKGTKGEKKKKLVRNLIDKIQKAINSDVQGLELDKKVKKPYFQIRKRTQNPFDYKDKINLLSLVKTVEKRQLNPISSIINKAEPLASISDGVTRKKAYNVPGFLTVFKSLNSAEMNELDVDYNSVMENGIPKRLQMPINTDNDDVPSHNDYLDIGNVTLYLKEIEGSGFSIGINQYTDEPPDKESLKLFTGLENLIQAYHEYYDHADTSISSEDTNDKIADNEVNNLKKDTNRYKRSSNVKLFTNVKSKSKMQKFLNTKAMQTKKIFLKNKRNKRHVDKIKIIASDYYPKQSNEHIYLVPHDDLFADRAIIREGVIPEVEVGEREDPQDSLTPYESIYNMAAPPRSEPYIASVYDIKAFHTELMSKYPHIILEDFPTSKENFINNRKNKNGPNISDAHKNRKINTETTTDVTNDYALPQERNNSLPNVEDIFNAILLPQTNYKLTVKILPKNKTEVGPGYKEVHTIINKSYDKNGVRYVSSMNVSEISQFQNLNKTSEAKASIYGEKEQQKDQINLLLKLHKDRIDQQLEHLKVESQQLNGMIGEKDQENWTKNITHIINVFKQLGLDEKNIISLAKHDHDIDNLTNSEGLSARSVVFNTSASTYSGEDSDKALLINTIKQNENFTREILQKIDKNTNILQSFLQSFTKRLEGTGEDNRRIKEKPVDLRSRQLSASDIEQLYKNNSNQIPFIYAFQQPITHYKEKDLKSVANIIYHGHIHANGVKNDENKNDFIKQVANTLKLRDNKNFNNTDVENNRFFIDELENDYKLVPNERIGSIASKNNTKI